MSEIRNPGHIHHFFRLEAAEHDFYIHLSKRRCKESCPLSSYCRCLACVMVLNEYRDALLEDLKVMLNKKKRWV